MKNGVGDESTRYEGSEKKDFDNQTVISEIELKF